MNFLKTFSIFLLLLSMQCVGKSIRQIDKDDLLEEELRADPEPLTKEWKEKELRDERKKRGQ
ncbi:MAG: hypothetical protein SFU98_19600 [Leptospiraceae bacterium]|nr:hypothetical protein [Leptospiraceae bacterium]